MPSTHSRFAPVVGMIVLLLVTGIVFFANYQEAPQDQGFRPPPPGATAPNAGIGAVRDDFRARIEDLEKRLGEAPEDTAVLSDLGRMMLASHRPERAAELFGRWVEVDPASGNAWLELARAQGALANWDAALDAMRERLKLGIDDAVGQYNLGAIYANLGNAEEAAAWWSRVVEDQADGDLVRKAEASLADLDGGGSE